MKRKQWEALRGSVPSRSSAPASAQQRAVPLAIPTLIPWASSSAASHVPAEGVLAGMAGVAQVRVRQARLDFAFWFRHLPREHRQKAARKALKFLLDNWPTVDIDNKHKK